MENQGLSALTRGLHRDEATGCLPRGTFGRAAAPPSSPRGSLLLGSGHCELVRAVAAAPGAAARILPSGRGCRAGGGPAAKRCPQAAASGKGHGDGQGAKASPAARPHTAPEPAAPPPGANNRPFHQAAGTRGGGLNRKEPRGDVAAGPGVSSLRGNAENPRGKSGVRAGAVPARRGKEQPSPAGRASGSAKNPVFSPFWAPAASCPPASVSPAPSAPRGAQRGCWKDPPCGRVALEPGCCLRHALQNHFLGALESCLASGEGLRETGGGFGWGRTPTSQRPPAASGCTAPPLLQLEANKLLQACRDSEQGHGGCSGSGRTRGASRGAPTPLPDPFPPPHPLGMRPGPSVPCRGGAPRP